MAPGSLHPSTTDRLGTTIHAYAAVGALANPGPFHCFAPFASLFARGPLEVVLDPHATRWPGSFSRPAHGEHVRDTIARAMGASRQPGLTLPSPSQTTRAGGVALCPHAAEPFKEWRESRWQALAEHLVAQGLDVAAYPAPGRARLSWPTGVVEHVLPLTALADALAASALAIAVDSGPAHLADLFGTPVVGLYAATSAVTYGPYGSRHRCVDRHAEAFPASRHYDTAVHVHGNPMDAVTVGVVARHVQDVFTTGP